MTLAEKKERLEENLRALDSVLVAFSGGVDSSFLLKAAHEVLGDKVLAVTARSATYPEREYREAVAFAAQYGIRHLTITSEELEVEGFSENPVNRCYLCKGELFTKLREVAGENKLKYVAEGSNHDDLGDFRPGLQAVAEQGIKSPLREAGLTKEDIRALSREMGLNTWNKPSFACLSSRFPYGEKITREKLEMVDKAEQLLLDLGFTQARVRHHGVIARIEVEEAEFEKLMDRDLRQKVYKSFRELGFTYTALDLKGYRTGSMNEDLNKQ